MWIQIACLFLSFISAGPDAPSWQKEVREIDQQIADLQDLQAKYRSQASRDSEKAMRWQFQNKNYLDARRAWDQVARDKQKIQEIQDQIDDLEDRKQRIIEEHGNKQLPS